MNIFKPHFWYDKRQRNGVLFLICIIILLQIVYTIGWFSKDEKTKIDTEEFEQSFILKNTLLYIHAKEQS